MTLERNLSQLSPLKAPIFPGVREAFVLYMSLIIPRITAISMVEPPPEVEEKALCQERIKTHAFP